MTVALAVDGEQHELQSVDKPDFGSDDEFQTVLLGLDVSPDCTGKRAFVGDGERAIAQFMRALNQFLRMGGAAQEGEVGKAVQFRLGGKHKSLKEREERGERRKE